MCWGKHASNQFQHAYESWPGCTRIARNYVHDPVVKHKLARFRVRESKVHHLARMHGEDMFGGGVLLEEATDQALN